MEKTKRRKNYYVQFNKKQKRNSLQAGVRGFLLTCNLRERDCIREAYNILNEYADKLYGPEKVEEISNNDNIEVSLENELQSLQAQAKQPRRFQQISTGVNNCLFIQTQLENPCEVLLSILKDLQETRMQKTTYLIRMVPVLATCKAQQDAIRSGVLEAISLFLKHFPEFNFEEKKTFYKVVYRVRNNTTLQKLDAFFYINSIIKEKMPGWEVNLYTPHIVLSIDILKVVCCISLMKGYFQYSKYNLLEVGKSERTASQQTQDKENETDFKDTTAESCNRESKLNEQCTNQALLCKVDEEMVDADSSVSEDSCNLEVKRCIDTLLCQMEEETMDHSSDAVELPI